MTRHPDTGDGIDHADLMADLDDTLHALRWLIRALIAGGLIACAVMAADLIQIQTAATARQIEAGAAEW